jgi:hypothetical protein
MARLGQTGSVLTAEIDLDAGPPPPRTAARGRRAPVVTAALIVTIVAAVLTGPTGSPTLTPAWQRGGAPYAWLTPSSVYTVDTSGGAVALVALDVRTGAVRWRDRLTGALAAVYASSAAVLATRFPPFVASPAHTEAIGDVPGWPPLTFPGLAMPLVQISGDVGIVIDRDSAVAAQPVADPTDRVAGLQWTYMATAIDLVTGAVRWSRTIPAGTVWSLPGVRPGEAGIVGVSQAWMVTSTASGHVEVWDLKTGAVRVRAELGPLEEQAYVLALADRVLVRHRNDASGAWVELRDPATLAVRARFTPSLPDAEPLSCAPDICLTANGGVELVDPAGGDTSLRLTATQLRPGPAGRLLVASFSKALSIVDTSLRTIDPVPGWQLVDASAYTGQAVLLHDVDSPGRRLVGLLDVGSGTFQATGAVSWSPGGRCQADAAHLACTDGRVLTVWPW